MNARSSFVYVVCAWSGGGCGAGRLVGGGDREGMKLFMIGEFLISDLGRNT
jgi:hypothetical protein